ncbi:uncharacterized protein LOC134395514 [Elgaria multicarinata webbii]|uniref:uncharacterized protein LOC134395514 n=1 Tax=Elgaria multicarinata webbii TaxID=159646 RepID=UPI002FCCF59E
MALLQDDNYHSSIKEHLAAGMQELVFLTGLMLLPWPYEEETCAKTRDHVSKAFRHFSEAEQKLEYRLQLVDSQAEALITVKKLIQDDLQEKKGNLADLRTQIIALREAEKKSQEMLEAAELHLESTREQLRLAHEEVEKNRVGREIGIRLMALPGLGTLIGAGMIVGYQAALDSAENLVAEAERAVNLCTAEVEGYSNEIVRFSQQAQEVQAGINSTEEKIPQIQSQCDELLAFQKKVTTQQSWIRKCLSLLDLLAGKIHAVEVMSSLACVPESLVDVLDEIGRVVGGKDGEAFHADKEIQTSVLEINRAVKSLRARAGESMPMDY